MKAYLLAMLIASSPVLAQSPQPPCGAPALPAHAQDGHQPNVQVWTKQQLSSWAPPPCLGWSRGGADIVIAMAGTFTNNGGADEALRRFGALSALRGIRYWSVTDKSWRPLITDAAAVTGADGQKRRADFSPEEMKPGRPLYFVQADSRSGGDVIYRMSVREASADRIVLQMENVSPVRAFFVTLFKPGGMRFDYFLQRHGNATWSAYGLLAVSSSRAPGNEASFINRMGAYYRHFTGEATDGAAPLAP